MFAPVYGRDVDDAPPTLPPHMRNDFAHKLKPAEQVQVERRPEIVQRQIRYVLARPRTAGVVHQNVHLAQSGRDLAMQRPHSRSVRYIGRDAQRARAERL